MNLKYALAAGVCERFESASGFSLAHVRLHEGSRAEQYADAIGAHAFTSGNHVWLGRNVSNSASPTLAHELVHVVQQTSPPRLGGQETSELPRDLTTTTAPPMLQGDFWSSASRGWEMYSGMNDEGACSRRNSCVGA